MNTNSPMSLGDLLSAAYSQKWRIGAFVVVTVAITVAVILWFPRTYRSQAELFVRVGRESVSLDPTATTGQMMQMVGNRELEIRSTVEMLNSRALAEKVVDELGPETVFGATSHEDAKAPAAFATMVGDAVGEARAAVSNIDPVDDREKAVIRILKNTSADTPKNTNVVTLTYQDDTPERAQVITAALVDAFLEEHIRINRTAGSEDFFVEQSKIMKESWDTAAEKLRDVKNELGLVSIGVQRNLLEQELNRLESELVRSRTSLTSMQARVEELEKLMEVLPERVVQAEESGFANQARDLMRQALFDLEIQERDLLAKFTEDHPRVIALRDQVEQARAILEEQAEDRTQATTVPNPAREKLKTDLLTAKAEQSALVALNKTLGDEVQLARDKIKQLNDNQVLIAKLEQDVEIAHQNYLTHSERLEQARIDGELEKDRISNINVIQAASFEPKPASPSKPLVAAGGMAICFLGSVLITLLGHQRNRSLRTEDDIEQRLDLPVLVSLPRNSGNGLPVGIN